MKSNNEYALLSASSVTSIATANQQIEALTTHGKKDAEEIAILKKQLAESAMNANQRIGVLEGQCKMYETELASLHDKTCMEFKVWPKL